MRVRLCISYKGTNYAGFQVQDGKATIAGSIEEALFNITGDKIRLIGASRTDSGVHSLGNIGVFDTDKPIAAEKYKTALNHFLPPDIRIKESIEVDENWHPRKVPSIKTYYYHIYEGRYEDPFLSDFLYTVSKPLDDEKMREGAKYLIGEHDFTSFASPHAVQIERGKGAVRTVYAAWIERIAQGWLSEGNVLRIKVSGNGFLYNMVRIIVGTLIDVGRGHIEPCRIKEILDAKDRSMAGPTAPAKGLIQGEINYNVSEILR